MVTHNNVTDKTVKVQTDQTKSPVKKSLSSFLVYYQNVRGLRTKTSEFYLSSISSCHFNAVALTETWLNQSIHNSELFDTSRYNIFRRDRNFALTGRKNGGGVLLAIDSSFNAISCNIDCDTLPNVDLVMVRISLNFRALFILVIYIPPSCDNNTYHILFDFLMSLTFLYDSDLLIIGDFNIPSFGCSLSHLPSLDSSYNYLRNFLEFYNLTQCNKSPNVNGKFLDLVLVSSSFNCSVNRSIAPFITEDNHHLALETDLQLAAHNKTLSINQSPEYNFRKCDLNALYALLLQTDWSPLYKYENVDQATSNFYLILTSILKNNVPLKKKISRKYPVWFN